MICPRPTFITAKSRCPALRDARSHIRIEGDPEAVDAGGRILRVSPLFLAFSCRARGGWVRDLPSKGSRSQLLGWSWQVLRLRNCR